MKFSELEWDDFAPSNKRKEFLRKQLISGLIALIIAIVLLSLLDPVRDLFLTDEELVEKYKIPRLEWLQKCDLACEEFVNIEYLNSITSCSALENLHDEERQSYMWEWRLAIDDRAGFLGCPNRPRDEKELRTEYEDTQQRIDRQKEQAIADEKQKLQDEIAREIPRFEESIAQSKIDHLIDRVQRDAVDADLVRIQVADAWFDQSVRLQKQIAQVLWQKWATIHSPNDTELSRIDLVNVDGDVIGGSPPNAGTPIWIRGE